MDPVEKLLESDEETLGLAELQKTVRLLSDEVQRHREELTKESTELQDLQTEQDERSRSRELYASLFVQILEIQEALEEEEETRQQLQELTREMERLDGGEEPEPSDALESRVMELESAASDYENKKKKLEEEAERLRGSLERSKEELTQRISEDRRVTEELHAAQASLTHHGRLGRSEMDLLLDSCVEEVRLLRAKKRRK